MPPAAPGLVPLVLPRLDRPRVVRAIVSEGPALAEGTVTRATLWEKHGWIDRSAKPGQPPPYAELVTYLKRIDRNPPSVTP